jgi:predicted metalloprotease with PDZ domain
MLKKLIPFSLLCLGSLFSFGQDIMHFDVDVTQNMDTFYVKATPPKKLKKANAIFQFPSTAPGTYQTMNIGRLVSDFKALDKRGKALKVELVDINQYKISKPKKVKSLTYKVAETFDTKLTELPIYMMAGSSIENDHTLINAHTLGGYFKGMQSNPVGIKILGKADWTTGSALKLKDGYYTATSFDELVDSPILSGKLTMAETKIADTPIRIFTYSEKGKLNSEMLLGEMKQMLESAEKFLVKLPVDNYTFLYYFLQNPSGVTGAWEHSYSSEYVLGEGEPNKAFLKSVVDIASHEFFHIVTPLNIHSEIIEHFNFEKPTPSQHLWLYEGVTEWASHMQLYRGGVTTFENYIANGIKQKILINELYFSPDWSLKRIADESFDGGEGAKQYGNIYYKGSLVASYLDIRLLELSGGKIGLRETLLNLVQKYGKGNPFNEKTFFDDLAAMTYPEIKDFTDKYIIANEALPHAEYLGKIGLEYTRVSDKNIVIKKKANPTENEKMLFDAWSVNLPW